MKSKATIQKPKKKAKLKEKMQEAHKKIVLIFLLFVVFCGDICAHTYREALQRYELEQLQVRHVHPRANSGRSIVTVLDPEEHVHIALIGSRVGTKYGFIYAIKVTGICVAQLKVKDKFEEPYEFVFLPAQSLETSRDISFVKEQIDCERRYGKRKRSR